MCVSAKKLCARMSFKRIHKFTLSSQPVFELCAYKECVYKNAIISPSVYASVCATGDHGVNLSSQAAVSYPRPCTLHPSPMRTYTLSNTPPSSSQCLGPRVNGCSTFPLSRSAKNYLLNDVCINIIYMVISLLLITAGLSAARGVG